MNAQAQSRSGLSRATLLVGLLGLAVVAAVSLWFVLQAAWADASTLGARATVNEWRDGSGPAITPELWERTRAQLQSALDSTPGNAQLHDDLGFLHAARSEGLGNVRIGSADHRLQQSLMDEAIAHYRAACALRPTFPYTWAYLALSKHYRGQHDDEFWSAYDHAMQYGRSEAALQGAIAEMAFALWPKLGAQRQQAIATMVATAKETSRTTLREMAQHAGVQLPV